jgi:hypothetical protein
MYIYRYRYIYIYGWWFPKMGVPPHHPFALDFPAEKPSSYWGTQICDGRGVHQFWCGDQSPERAVGSQKTQGNLHFTRENGGFTREHGEFTGENGDFTGKNGDFTGENGDFTGENGDVMVISWDLPSGKHTKHHGISPCYY